MSYRNLYIHIPFCHRICHYCDFAKTALYSESTKQTYFTRIAEYCRILSKEGAFETLESLFIGGGTPSLFTNEYEGIFQQLAPYLNHQTEVTLECNPEDVSDDSLEIWKSLGVNRLSLGIQTFNIRGLKELTREHKPQEAEEAVLRSIHSIGNVNIDLIYGWNKQTAGEFEADLLKAIKLGANHISCYSLTYEQGTVLGRRIARSVQHPTSDEKYAELYEVAKRKLEGDYIHEEISNWSKPGHACRHNWNYWSNNPFIGLGVGAHGYLADHSFGRRYSFTSSIKRFIESPAESFLPHDSVAGLMATETLTPELWMMEQVVTCFRTIKGLSVDTVCSKGGFQFKPSKALEKGILEGIVEYRDHVIKLKQSEWLRENLWCRELANSFTAH